MKSTKGQPTALQPNDPEVDRTLLSVQEAVRRLMRRVLRGPVVCHAVDYRTTFRNDPITIYDGPVPHHFQNPTTEFTFDIRVVGASTKGRRRRK